MPSYAAFIGHQPSISLAELAASVPGFLLHDVIDRNVVLFDSAETLGSAFLDTLGGTVILVEKLPAGKPMEPQDAADLLVRELMSVKGKAVFSIRSIGVAPQTIKKLYRDTKETLKKKGKPSRYVGNEHAPAPSIVLRQGEMLDSDKRHGCELCMIRREEEDLWVGFTKGAQDIEAYTKRDMGKPVRDTGVGLLPPKLAQILINFGVWLAARRGGSRTSATSPGPMTVYDPFCGTGVIPMECLLRGFHVLASDKSEKAVSGCTKNLDWLRRHMEIKKSDVPSRVWKHDATKPFDVKEHVDVIVTESSLGPALEKRPTAKDIQSMRSENEKLQAGFLQAASAAFPKAPIVCTWPVWYSSKTPVYLERVWDAADKAGYEPILPPSVEFTGGRLSLVYRRPEQFVGREIVLLRPKR